MRKVACENIIIEATNVCTANCVFCPREQYVHKPKHMPQDLFEKIIDEALELGLKSVAFGGFGEPLCDPDLIEKLRYLKRKDKNSKIYLTSTLFLLNEKLIDEFTDNVDAVHVSFYGMTPETYEKIHRGALKFERSKNNILSLIDRKRTLKSPKPSIIMRYLLNEFNADEMEQFIAFWEPLVDEVMVWKPHNYLYGRRYREVDVDKGESCGRPFADALNLDIEGRVTVCCFDFNKELEIGNVSRQGIKEILSGEKLQKLRHAHSTRNFTGLLCESCDQRVKDPDVLVYSTDKNRSINALSLSRLRY